MNTCLQDPLDLQSFGPVSLPFEIQDSIIYAPSPSGTRTFLVRAGEGSHSTVLEIWEGPRCIKQLQVSSSMHGVVLNEGAFSGGASWSKDETKVAYVAEVRHFQRSNHDSNHRHLLKSVQLNGVKILIKLNPLLNPGKESAHGINPGVNH